MVYNGPRSGSAEMWHIPPPDDLYLIKESGDVLPRVIGEHGPRPITNRELLRWTLFRIFLDRWNAW